MTSAPTRKSRIGVFGIGLAAYWPQFAGLKERLEGYQREVESRCAGFGARDRLRRPGGYARRPRALPATCSRAPTRTCWSAMSAPTPPRPRCSRRAEGARAGAGAESPACRGARLREHRHRRMAGQLFHLLRSRRSRTRSRARASISTWSRVRWRGPEAWDEIEHWCRAAGRGAARSAAHASASWATPIPGCSTCTRTSRLCTRSSAPMSKLLEM